MASRYERFTGAPAQPMRTGRSLSAGVTLRCQIDSSSAMGRTSTREFHCCNAAAKIPLAATQIFAVPVIFRTRSRVRNRVSQ